VQAIFNFYLKGHLMARPLRVEYPGAAITMKYNQMNTELMRNKKLSDKIATLKKQLLNI